MSSAGGAVSASAWRFTGCMHRLSATRPSLRPAQLGLEALDGLNGHRIDATRLGELEGDEVAQHHGVEQALGTGLALRLHPDHRGRMRLDRLGRELEPLPLPRVLVAVLEKDRGEALVCPAPALELV